MADIAFDNITQEVRGIVYPGKLRLRENDFMFKNDKTGKVDHFMRSDLVSAQWIARATGLGLRIKLKNDTSHRYDGFGDLDAEKVVKFFKTYFDIEITKRELCYKGFNWGDVEIDGDVLEMSVKNAMSFEIPLSNLSNATLNKNEIVFEFHLNDDAEICLSEMRIYTPGTEADRDGKAPLIYSKVTEKADIIQVPKSTITRLLLLPHPDNRQIFFVVQLDPPIKHGQTRYHFVILLFDKDSHVDIEMAASEEWLQEHFNGKLTQNVAGPEYEVVARIFKLNLATVCFIFHIQVEARNGLTHTFTSIDRNEYHQLYDFVTSKKLRVKNIDSETKPGGALGAEDAWSSSDESHDAYMEKVKTEARERQIEIDEDDDDDEDDEDFQPPPESEASELAEEYDSNVQTTTSEENSDDDDDESGSGSEPEPQPKKVKPIQEPKKVISKPKPSERPKKTKRVKDPNAPTRPPTAYLMWFNEHREEIAKSIGGSSSVAEVAKAAGERWRSIDSETKSKYQSRVDELKQKYEGEMRVYRDRVASGELPAPSSSKNQKTSRASKPSTSKSVKPVSSSTYKSQEYVATSDELSDLSADGADKSGTESDVSD
ncbi:structure-specific recognition protein 1 [Paragonimus westermani]|uniref:FACT complex subunit SSRP1 n=1 Tax=Paragonimus westermani TaxID=34504 RepID=A0A5J4NYL2_9TREM|nr:structure-specific recognition protein 1 [Paragonimus westermani]